MANWGEEAIAQVLSQKSRPSGVPPGPEDYADPSDWGAQAIAQVKGVEAQGPSAFDRTLGGLETITAPLGYAKRGIDALARAGSRFQGLDVPDTATTGSLARTALGLDPSQDEFSRSVTGRLLGKGVEFGTDLATDPLTYALGGAAKTAAAGKALQGAEALMTADEAAQALKTIEAGRKAALVGRGAAAAFAPGMLLGGAREAEQAYKRYQAGDIPGAAEAALGAGLSGGFGALSASHALHGEAPLRDTRIDERPVAQGFGGETRPTRNFTQETLPPDAWEGSVPPEFEPAPPMLRTPSEVRAEASGLPNIFEGTGDPLRDAELAGGNARAQAAAEEAQFAAMLEARAKARAAAQKTPEEIAADLESVRNPPNVWNGPEQALPETLRTPAEVAADLRGEEPAPPAPAQGPVPMLGHDEIPADYVPPIEETPGPVPSAAEKLRKSLEDERVRHQGESALAAERAAAQPAPATNYAYRARNLDQQGISHTGHAQASTSLADVRRLAPSRAAGDQEIVRVNLDKLSPNDYELIKNPGGEPWVKFKRPIAESEVEKVGPVTEIDRQAADKATPEIVQAVTAQPVDALAQSAGLSVEGAAKGIADVEHDGLREIRSPEATAVKRAVLEARATNRPPAFETTASGEPARAAVGQPSDSLRLDEPLSGTDHSLQNDYQERVPGEMGAGADEGRPVRPGSNPPEGPLDAGLHGRGLLAGGEAPAGEGLHPEGSDLPQAELGAHPGGRRGEAIDATLQQMERRLRTAEAPTRVPVRGKNGIETKVPVAGVRAELGLEDLDLGTTKAGKQRTLSNDELAARIRKDGDNPIFLQVREAAERADPFGYLAAAEEQDAPPRRNFTQETLPDEGPAPSLSVRRAPPGQRGLPGIAEDVAPAREKPRAPEQQDLFGAKDMLVPTEARVTEGREADGPLFTQERDQAARAEAEKQKPLFKASETPATEAKPPDREAVRSKLEQIFKGQKVEDARVTPDSPVGPTSPFVIKTPSGKRIWVEPTGEIAFNQASAERHGPGVAEAIQAGEARATGSAQRIGTDAWVKIVDEGVLPHEIGGHVFLEHFATPAERAFLEKHYSSESELSGKTFDELFSNDYNDWWDKRQQPTSALGNIFGRIRDFFERMKRAVGFESRAGLFREIESGRPFDRTEGIPTGVAGMESRVRPIPDTPRLATAPAVPPKPRTPMGQTMAEAGVAAPRVEAKVENLREVAPGAELSRDAPRTWESLDPKVADKLRKMQRDPMEEVRLYSRAKEGKVDDVDIMTLDALVSGKNEAMASARDAMNEAQAKGNAVPEKVAYLKSVFDASVADLAKAARSDVEAGTRLARALAARARVMNAVVLGDTDSVLRKIFREIPDITDEQAGKLAEVLQKGSQTDAQAALHASLKPKTLNKWIEGWKNGLVSAPGTQVANILGNIAEAATRIVETAASAAVDPLLGGPKTRLAGEAKFELQGSLKGAMDSMGRLSSDLHDIVTLAPEKIDLTQPFERQTGAIGGKFGRFVRIPFRTLGAWDQFFKGIAQQAELNKMAYRLNGGDMAKAEKMANTPIEELPDSIRKHLFENAQERTFQNPNEAAKAFSRLRNQFPVLHVIAPFIETPLNIANLTVKRSPYGFIEAGKAYRAYKAAVHAGESAETIARLKGEAVDKMARPLVGTAVMATFAAVAQSGAMTGSGPTDPKEANALKDGGWQPYSFVYTGADGKRTYIPYNRFEPVSSLLGFAADMAEARGAKDKAALFDKGLGSIGQNLFSKTYLQGIAEAASAIHDPKQFADQYVSNLAGSVVPNIVAKAAQAVDPAMRDVRPGEGGTIERIGKTLVSRIPGASSMLPARASGTGQVVERPGNVVSRFLSPVQVTDEKDNLPFQEMLVATDAVPTAPRKEIRQRGKDVPLTNTEFKALQDADAETTKQLERLFRAPSFKALPTERRKQIIDSRYNQGRSLARSMITASPDFRKRLSVELRNP